jgi:hypothetical protein
MYTLRDSCLDQYYTSTSLGQAAHRRRLSSSHVYCLGFNRPISESF